MGSLDLEELKRQLNEVIDRWADGQPKVTFSVSGNEPVEAEIVSEPAPERVKPEGKRVVRTKSSGDRVYELDENEKTRRWLTNGQVLEGRGWGFDDVEEIEDTELLGYQMGSAIYKAD